jgi:hypothetical protein
VIVLAFVDKYHWYINVPGDNKGFLRREF